jgi:outer membrane protein assembly factor BamE (lipoprotein component of BamABCDE complex)
MRRVRNLAVLALLAQITSGCVSMGSNYDAAAVQRLTPGMDRSEVIAMLGRPTTSVTLEDRSQHLVWTHSRGSMFGATARSLTLIFGPDGKYLRTFSEAETQIR